MAVSYTTTYNLTKPEVGASEDEWGGLLNTNFDNIDNLLDGTTPITGIDINSGTIDGAVIGGATPAAGTFTTLTANTSIGGTLSTAAQPNVTSVGTLTSLDVTGTVTADGLTVDGDIRVNTTSTPSTTGVNLVLADTSNASALQLHNNLGGSDGGSLLYSSSASYFNIYNYTGAVGSETYVNRFGIANNGDISFYEDTGTTPKFFWDASAESLGIGTSSPSDDLEISTSADAKGLTIKNAGNNRPYLNFDSNRSGAGNNLAQLNFKWNGADVARIIAVAGSDTTNKDDGHITFNTSSSGSVEERMRIDSSGNLLVGTTSNSPTTTAGINLGSNNKLHATRSSGTSGYFNRLTSDGGIVEFAKDGSTVGSISSRGGVATNLILRTATGQGAGIGGANSGVLPCDEDGLQDDEINLGASGTRWKDLYLSGGVYLGGTGSANKLDDYEEGTWTPIITFGGASVGQAYSYGVSKYTKIGNLVTATCYLAFSNKGTSAGSAILTGLPFPMSNTIAQYVPAAVFTDNVSFADMLIVFGEYGTSQLYLQEVSNAGTRSSLNDTNFANNSSFSVSITYDTTA